jgi:hypothetical protein
MLWSLSQGLRGSTCFVLVVGQVEQSTCGKSIVTPRVRSHPGTGAAVLLVPRGGADAEDPRFARAPACGEGRGLESMIPRPFRTRAPRRRLHRGAQSRYAGRLVGVVIHLEGNYPAQSRRRRGRRQRGVRRRARGSAPDLMALNPVGADRADGSRAATGPKRNGASAPARPAKLRG